MRKNGYINKPLQIKYNYKLCKEETHMQEQNHDNNLSDENTHGPQETPEEAILDNKPEKIDAKDEEEKDIE